METNNIYIPGDIWLYYKLYTGPKMADKILISYLLPIIDRLYESSMIDLFFFIRYNDPDFHLRIRFKTKQLDKIVQVLNPIWKQLVREQKISRVLIDSYIQEESRYEKENMEIVESIFFIDSYSCLQMLRYLHLNKEDLSNTRWLLSLKIIDRMLNTLGYNKNQKFKFISSLAKEFREEFLFTNHKFTKQINEKYRSYRSIINYIMEDDSSQVTLIINERAKQLLPLFQGLKINNNNAQRVIGSIIHMFMNRWFRSQNRLYEMMIYSFMEKNYKQPF